YRFGSIQREEIFPKRKTRHTVERDGDTPENTRKRVRNSKTRRGGGAVDKQLPYLRPRTIDPEAALLRNIERVAEPAP
ncbi:hypothetical protein OLB04_11535, partial [Streptococcus pneumoniae]|nr:hypothetical protein [Streptococcus pneumoniae]